MEKKGNRNTSNPSRASSGTDLKKSIDVSTTKQGTRATPRRREPPCGFSKSIEATRKPQPQRNSKASDKRPKPRGSYHGGTVPRNEETCLEEFEEPEWGSVFSPGSKKQSLNHLLNFSFAPRENLQSNYHYDRGGNKQDAKWLTTKKHKYNKNHYLQANCQFIVNEKGNYQQYMNNPDTLVDWDLIEQVNVQVNEEPLCPICLYPAVAAKITKCGHIYCWSCMLHYLALSDKDWRKCPICFDAIKKDDLKSVTVIPHNTFNVNDIITFKLMKRLRGSFTAYPADASVNLGNHMFNISEKNVDNCSSKLFLANTDNILDILNREDKEIEQLISEDDNCPEICFMEAAKQIIQTKRNEVLASQTIQKEVSNDVPTNLGIKKCTSNATLDEKEESSPVLKYFYFYQAEDGQHIYLNAINAKMLEHTYGSLEFGPKLLSGQILEKEGGSMTEELRDKMRYLQHLPITCQFEVAEIKLGEPIVNKETMEHFKEQLVKRRKKRQRRAYQETVREKKIEAEENRKIGKYETPNLHLESKFQFPDVKESHIMFPDFLEHKQRTDSESTVFSQNDRSLSPDLNSSVSVSLETNYTGPSFAMMLATQKKSIPKKSKLTNQPSSVAVQFISVTGANMSGIAIKNKRRDSDPICEDFEPVPEYNQNLGDALAKALEGLGCNEETKNNDAKSSCKKKKKKTKQKLLFSTHMTLPGN